MFCEARPYIRFCFNNNCPVSLNNHSTISVYGFNRFSPSLCDDDDGWLKSVKIAPLKTWYRHPIRSEIEIVIAAHKKRPEKTLNVGYSCHLWKLSCSELSELIFLNSVQSLKFIPFLETETVRTSSRTSQALRT